MSRLYAPQHRNGLLRGLVSCWELGEPGGLRFDAHGTNYLTDNNTVTFGAGKMGGGAAAFALANTEYLSRAANASLNTNTATTHTTDITVILSAYLAAKTTVQIFAGKGLAAGGDEWVVYYNSGTDRFELQINDGGTADTATASTFGSPSVTTFYMITVTVVGSTGAMTISVNAGPRNTATATHWATSMGGAFALGAYRPVDNLSLPFGGRMQKVCFWKRVLSVTEEARMFNNGNVLSYRQMCGEAVRPRFFSLPAQAGAGGIFNKSLELNQAVKRAAYW